MFEDGLIDEDNFIDISTEKAMKKHLNPAQDDWDDRTIDGLGDMVRFGCQATELLFCWRGEMPLQYCYMITPPPT